MSCVDNLRCALDCHLVKRVCKFLDLVIRVQVVVKALVWGWCIWCPRHHTGKSEVWLYGIRALRRETNCACCCVVVSSWCSGLVSSHNLNSRRCISQCRALKSCALKGLMLKFAAMDQVEQVVVGRRRIASGREKCVLAAQWPSGERRNFNDV